MAALGQASRGAHEIESRDWLTPALAVGCFVNMVSTMAISPFLPLISAELDASVALLGQIPSLTMLLAAMLGLVAGPLADRFGYRLSLSLGLLTAAVSTFGLALAPGLLPLFLAGLFGAVGRSVVTPTAQAVISVTIPDEDARRRAISWVATGQTAAPLIGIPVLTTVAAITHWRLSFAMVGCLSILVALAVWRMLPTHAAPTRKAGRLRDVLGAYAPLVRHRPSLALILASLVTNIGAWATFTYLGAFFVQVHAYTTSEVGGAYLICGIGTVLGTRVVGGRLGAHPRRLLIAGRILGGASVLVALTLPVSAPLALGLLTVAALASTMSMAATTVLLASDAPGGKGTTLTLHVSAISLGTALGAAVGGLILALADYGLIGIVSMVCYVASALLVWQLHVPAAASEDT
jgi:MFS transporter, DHA1 family, inner membrane transport protein